MGDIAFDVTKNVDLNKQVNLDIDKDVDVNVVNDDLLATSEADAEAFGENALAETDAFTYVNEEGGDVIEEFIPNPGGVDLDGNTNPFVLGEDGDDDGTLPDNIQISFLDLDDINGFDSLAPLDGNPAGSDVPNGVPLFSITDLNLTEVADTADTTPGGDPFAEYTNNEALEVNFGERTLDLDGDGIATDGILTLDVPAGTDFIGIDTGTGFEVTFEDLAAGDAVFTFTPSDGSEASVFPTEGNFIFVSDDLFAVPVGDWGVEAASQFGRDDVIVIPGDGEAFSYGESTAALDLGGNANDNGDIA